MTRLAGHTALVTGAGRRVGAVLATRLARAGADVVLHYGRSKEAAQKTAQRVRNDGRHAWTLQADLADAGAVAGLVPAAAEAVGGPITLLVNNASVFPEDTMETMTRDDLDQNMHVNAWAPLALMRAFAEQAPRRDGSDDGEAGKGPQGREGLPVPDPNVINLLDTRATDYDWHHVPYILSKKTLWEMTRMAALHYAPHMRVNGIAPGPVLHAPGDSDEAFQALAKAVPLQRVGDPDLVADATLYLATATYTTGEVLCVDGGRHLGRMVHGR